MALGSQLCLALLCSAGLVSLVHAGQTVKLDVPASTSSSSTGVVVYPNFLGVSFELSFIDEYFGPNSSNIPGPFIQALSAIRKRTQSHSLRLRIGGNSMDSSTYDPQQTSPMLQLTNEDGGTTDAADDQPVKYGPTVWDVLKGTSSKIGGASYLIGLSLFDPNNPNVPVVAGAAAQALDEDLDAFLLGNEPDLYGYHGHRPGIKNYTVDDYIADFAKASSHLTNTAAGSILDKRNLAGPTMCCEWNLNSVLQSGYLSNFSSSLKYVTTQHYPQNNCFGSYQYQLPWYMQHFNTVQLAKWQNSGVSIANQASNGQQNLRMIMSEFNSVSCGGVPGISDTFAVGSMWTVDYALQLASVGYSAAFVHTRERGISYNVFSSPNDTSVSQWTINPPFYALLVASEAMQSNNGSYVVDLNADNSMNSPNATLAAYGIYEQDQSIRQIVLFNYDSSPSTFTVPSSGSKNTLVRYLSSSGSGEKNNIAWGGETYAGTGDGKIVKSDASWATADTTVDCKNGCDVNVPAPGVAVVFLAGAPQTSAANTLSEPGVIIWRSGLLLVSLWVGAFLSRSLPLF